MRPPASEPNWLNPNKAHVHRLFLPVAALIVFRSEIAPASSLSAKALAGATEFRIYFLPFRGLMASIGNQPQTGFRGKRRFLSTDSTARTFLLISLLTIATFTLVLVSRHAGTHGRNSAAIATGKCGPLCSSGVPRCIRHRLLGGCGQQKRACGESS